MIKTYKFTPGGWDPDDFFYAYSPRWHTRKQFLQEED